MFPKGESNSGLTIRPKNLFDLNDIMHSWLFSVFGTHSIKIIFVNKASTKFLIVKDTKINQFDIEIGIAGQTVISEQMLTVRDPQK